MSAVPESDASLSSGRAANAASVIGELSYGRSEFIWVTSALLLYWISYMWLTAHRGRMTDDPLVFALKDRVSQVLIALMGATAWLAV